MNNRKPDAINLVCEEQKRPQDTKPPQRPQERLRAIYILPCVFVKMRNIEPSDVDGLLNTIFSQDARTVFVANIKKPEQLYCLLLHRCVALAYA